MLRPACHFVVKEKAKPGIGGYKLCVPSKDFIFIPQMKDFMVFCSGRKQLWWPKNVLLYFWLFDPIIW